MNTLTIRETKEHCELLEPFTKMDGKGADQAKILYPLYRQLADTMRENERLKKLNSNFIKMLEDRGVSFTTMDKESDNGN